jgi:hypothetical protein
MKTQKDGGDTFKQGRKINIWNHVKYTDAISVEVEQDGRLEASSI